MACFGRNGSFTYRIPNGEQFLEYCTDVPGYKINVGFTENFPREYLAPAVRDSAFEAVLGGKKYIGVANPGTNSGLSFADVAAAAVTPDFKAAATQALARIIGIETGVEPSIQQPVEFVTTNREKTRWNLIIAGSAVMVLGAAFLFFSSRKP